jgi:hypothetical protein
MILKQKAGQASCNTHSDVPTVQASSHRSFACILKSKPFTAKLCHASIYKKCQDHSGANVEKPQLINFK